MPIPETLATNRRRVTVPFAGRDMAFEATFEYAPDRYNVIVQRSYRLLRKHGKTAAADAFLLSSLLTAWDFDYPLTPAAIGMFDEASKAGIAQTILADLTTYRALTSLNLRTTAPPVSA